MSLNGQLEYLPHQAVLGHSKKVSIAMSNVNYHEIYRNAFADASYCNVPDSEFRWEYCRAFIQIHRQLINTIADVGTGRGNLISILMREFPQLQIMAIDVGKYHNKPVPHITIDLVTELGQRLVSEMSVDVVTCVDVLEHLEEPAIGPVIAAISQCCRFAVLTIANHSDIMNGTELHLTQKPMNWWRSIIEEDFVILDETQQYSGRLYAFRVQGRPGSALVPFTNKAQPIT